jgi:hypothetical protein
VVALAGLLWWPFWVVAGVMLLLAFGVACVLAIQAKLPREYGGFRSRLIVAGLSYAQPLVRSWRRYKTWLFAFPVPGNGKPDPVEGPVEPLPLAGGRTVDYWSEEWRDRTELLIDVVGYLSGHRWSRAIDSGWSAWDLEVSGDRYTAVRVVTAQEDHGSGKRLIRVRYRLRPRGTFWLLAGLGVVLPGVTAVVNPVLAGVVALTAIVFVVSVWLRGLRIAGQVVRVFDATAAQMKLVRCDRPNAGAR